MEKNVEDGLKQKGARVKAEWVAQCLAFLRSGSSKPTTVATAISFAWEQFLLSDMRLSAEPVLPATHGLHKQTLAGPFVLQINEIVNIAEPLERRYEQAQGGKRMLKLLLTDGVNQIVAAELEHVPQLSIDMLAGCKVEISRVKILQGMMMLSAASIKVLGGHVDQLVELANATRLEVKRGLLPKEWMEELKDTMVTTGPAQPGPAPQAQIPMLPPSQVPATPSAPKNINSALMGFSQNKIPSVPTPAPLRPSLSKGLSTPAMTPSRALPPLDLTDSPSFPPPPSKPSYDIGIFDTPPNKAFVDPMDIDDGLDFDILEAQINEAHKRKEPQPPPPQRPQISSAAASRRVLAEDYEEEFPRHPFEEDEEVMMMLQLERDADEKTSAKAPKPPPARPSRSDSDLNEKDFADIPTSAEDLYKSFKRPGPNLSAPSPTRTAPTPALKVSIPDIPKAIPIKAPSFPSVKPVLLSTPQKPPPVVQELDEEEDSGFNRMDLANVTPRSTKRIKRETSKMSLNLDRVPESPPRDEEAFATPFTKKPLQTPSAKAIATIEIEDSPEPVKRKGSLSDLFPKPALNQTPIRSAPKILDMVDDEEMPDDVPHEIIKTDYMDVDSVGTDFKVETFVPAVPAKTPLQSLPNRRAFGSTQSESSTSVHALDYSEARVEIKGEDKDEDRGDDEMDFEPQEPPLVYIRDSSRFKPAKARVKGFVAGVIKDSFRVAEEKFSMQIKIDDGSGVAVVRLSHEMITPLMSNMTVDKYYQMQTSGPQQKALKLIIGGIVKKLQQMNGIFYLDKWNTVDPVVTKFSSSVGLAQDLGWELLHRIDE